MLYMYVSKTYFLHTYHVYIEKKYLYIYSNALVNQSEFRFCIEVGDHGAPFASVKCLHTAPVAARSLQVGSVSV